MFVPQVGRVAYAADEHAGVMLPAERGGQPGPRGNGNVVPVRGKVPAQLDGPFRYGAGRLLAAVDGHQHGDPGEKTPCPLDDVEVTGGEGIEGTGIDRMPARQVPSGRVEHHPRLPPAAGLAGRAARARMWRGVPGAGPRTPHKNILNAAE